MADSNPPLWLLAELSYACPLQCPYCSNPVNFSRTKAELTTAQWIDVFQQARALGAAQLGLSGGEPATRRDLETLVEHARELGFYTNLITSGVGLDRERIAALKSAGLDHIQVSFQAATRELNDHLAGTRAFEHKLDIARAVKSVGYPMVLCFVLNRHNLHQIPDMLRLAQSLDADYVELATTQYYGWALINRSALLPKRTQLEQAEKDVEAFRADYQGAMKIYYVVPDYYEKRPKACMNGWGKLALNITPDGTALPCHAAQVIPGLEFPNVKDHALRTIWYESAAFNQYRGDAWMKTPCRTCPEKSKDLGGCRCQAYLLTGDAANADPVCDKSPHHGLIQNITAEAASEPNAPLVFRTPKNSKKLSER